ncbi:hypothetical protein EON83_27445 [bacterium]|nr:MAG: hypothetical protein EON83_27445 [bacterium]
MKVLYSPLGLSYGTLYSAILLTRPDRIVIVTSVEAINALGTTLDAARFYHSAFEFETHVLNDPLAGFSEGRILARFMAASSERENLVNLCGGTAAMQDCVASLASILRRDGKHVREVAAIDRRDLLEQRRAPLVVGELVEISPAV